MSNPDIVSDINVGSKAAWQETYFTASNVLYKRLVWGVILDVVYSSTGSALFPVAGNYISLRRPHSDDPTPVLVLEADLLLIHP